MGDGLDEMGRSTKEKAEEGDEMVVSANGVVMIAMGLGRWDMGRVD